MLHAGNGAKIMFPPYESLMKVFIVSPAWDEMKRNEMDRMLADVSFFAPAAV